MMERIQETIILGIGLRDMKVSQNQGYCFDPAYNK